MAVSDCTCTHGVATGQRKSGIFSRSGNFVSYQGNSKSLLEVILIYGLNVTSHFSQKVRNHLLIFICSNYHRQGQGIFAIGPRKIRKFFVF